MQPSQSRGKGTLSHSLTHSLSRKQQRERKNAVEEPSGDGRAASNKKGAASKARRSMAVEQPVRTCGCEQFVILAIVVGD